MERRDARPKRPSVRGLARLADVSPSTVSRALSGKEGVSDATRAHIMRIAKEKGFLVAEEPGGWTAPGEGGPAGAGADLLPGKERAVAFTLLVDVRGNPRLIDLAESVFFMELVGGLSAAVRDFDASLNVVRVEEDSDLDRFLAPMDREGNRPDGVVWLGYQPFASYEPWVRRLVKQSVPVVLCDHHVAGLACDSVLSDNIGGSLAAARHLAELGHTRVVILQQALPSVAAVERTRGYRAGLLECGIPASDIAVVEAPPSVHGGYDVADSLFERGFTGVLCGNDEMAIGVLRRARERGIGVPDEISICGFDDISTSALITPALTTVRVDKRAIGYESVRRLMTRVREKSLGSARRGGPLDAGASTPVRSIIPTGLVVRESTGVVPPRASGRAAGS